MYSVLVRPLLFRLPAEAAHELAFRVLRPLQWFRQRWPGAPSADPLLTQDLWGLHFAHPLGLAAGFDKNGRLPHVWPALGFAFAELGTVTARPQAGNPPPRLFRLAAERALINRLGFNNAGASAVAAGLAARFVHGRPGVPIGINLGKSKLVPLEQAADDYCAGLRQLFRFADYVAINISSPNTPGLRDLQAEAHLVPLLAAVQDENHRLALAHQCAPRPLLLKLAPDLGDDALAAIAAAAVRQRVAGFIATNTTIERVALAAQQPLRAEAGGLSGPPLRDRATAVVRALYRASAGRVPIIGVGGIASAADAYEKIRAGASLVQVYTGFVYGGPRFACRLVTDLRGLLRRDGFTHVSRAVGTDAAGRA